MASRQAAAAAGVSGVVFTVSRADGNAAAAGLHVSVDYASFAYAYGGDYAARLRLVELRACALTTPRVAACRRQTPVPSADDVATRHLGGNVTLPAAVTAASAAGGAVPAVVLATTTSPSGSAGDYSATPLSEAGSWSEGGSSGAFTYSYPITVPPVPGGLAPDVSLGYDSQAVDGLTSSTNNQASWIGDGWSYDPGYVEEGYEPCSQDTALPSADRTGDLCWTSNNVVTLSLNGQVTTLVDDPQQGWHGEADNGERITYQTGTSNGTKDGGYWVVTQQDGTSYYFGLNELPGYASGDTQTDSTWTVPVYATASSGQLCYNATFADASCPRAWRWNLDYVTDTHKDAMAYFYATETNYYASATDKATTGTSPYVQAGALSKIEYGLRTGSVYGTTPAAEVNFTAPASRTDIPTDLACAHNAVCSVQSPTFWGKYQLTTIATQTLEGSSLEPVDSYALAQDYPTLHDATTTPSLWLESITRCAPSACGGSGVLQLPPVSFEPTPLPNRVESAAELNDGYSIITRMRMHQITNETGGQTTVAYDTAPSSCTSGNFPAPDANSTLCYPDYWTPPGKTIPIEDWFNKYVVSGVTEADTTGGGQPVQTQYSYGGAAWHYNDDTLTRSSQRTWDQWRGFRIVTAETGTAPDPVTQTTDTYFQGMDGDYQSGGGASSVSLTSSQGGDTVADSDQLAGMDFEHVVYDGHGGPVVTDTVRLPWTSGATAVQSQPSLPTPLQAFMTGTEETKVFTPLALGGTRESDTTYTHDSYGRVISTSSIPDTAQSSEDTCTATSYASNTSTWLLDLPAEVSVTSVPCGTTATLPGDGVSDTRTYYDGSATLGAEPSAGDVTMTQLATSYAGSTPSFTTESTASYDQYGRVSSSTDADSRTTTTSYTPPTGAEPTSQTVTDPAGLATTTTYDPTRELPLTVTNPALWVTSETYDALGRLTAVWTPGHKQGAVPADKTFTYFVSASSPSLIETNTINDTGGYITSETLYDSLGRVVQTLAETPDGGVDRIDTYYNSDGWKNLVSNSYYTSATSGNPCWQYSSASCPNVQLWTAPDDQVPSQTGYVYDGDGRVTKQISYKFAAEQYETDSSYGGDYTTLVPPSGGSAQYAQTAQTAQTAFTDGEGDTSAIYQYHSGVPASPSDPPSDYDKTTYAYFPARQLAQVTDPAGNTWSYTYNRAGDKVSSSDPDTGPITSVYDSAGQLMSTTDARGKTISYSYDLDGRKIAEYDTTGGAAETGSDELASWRYDTLAKGQLTSATSYVGGTNGLAYTEGVSSYNAYGLPNGTYTKIPNGTGLPGALAGQYNQAFTYEPYANLLESYTDQGTGGLLQETVDLGYDTANNPVSLESQYWYYVAQLAYTELDQPQQYAFGTTGEPAYLNLSYYQDTGWLQTVGVVTGASTSDQQTVEATTYLYDDAGNITAESDIPANGSAQEQCFQYDYLGRLTEAWSQGSAACATTPSQSAEGGAAPYWESYAYNDQNDLTTLTSTPPAGAATTVNSTYPAPGQPQVHAPASQQSSGPAGTTTTSYRYDPAGNTTSVTAPASGQTLNWNDAGQLASVTTTGSNAGTTSYTYDADGSLLMQSDPGSVTLYLPDEEIVATTGSDGTTTVSGTRYYSIGGVTVAARTTTGTATMNGDVSYLTGNQQGTDSLAIDSATLHVSRRYYDPYGNPVGTTPSSWPGTRSFVGGTADPATGYTNLGAREYNPATSAFISPDSLINPYDPQDLNAYAYAADNPASKEDPTGQSLPGEGGTHDPCGVDQQSCNPTPTGGGDGDGATPEGGGRTDPSPAPSASPLSLIEESGLPNVRQIIQRYEQELSQFVPASGDRGTALLIDEWKALQTLCGDPNAGCGALLPGATHGLFDARTAAQQQYDAEMKGMTKTSLEGYWNNRGFIGSTLAFISCVDPADVICEAADITANGIGVEQGLQDRSPQETGEALGLWFVDAQVYRILPAPLREGIGEIASDEVKNFALWTLGALEDPAPTPVRVVNPSAVEQHQYLDQNAMLHRLWSPQCGC